MTTAPESAHIWWQRWDLQSQESSREKNHQEFPSAEISKREFNIEIFLRASATVRTQPTSYLHRDHTTVGEQQSRLLGTEQLCLCITCIIVESNFFFVRAIIIRVSFFCFVVFFFRSLSDGEAIPCPCRRPNLRKRGGRGPAGSCQLEVEEIWLIGHRGDKC